PRALPRGAVCPIAWPQCPAALENQGRDSVLALVKVLDADYAGPMAVPQPLLNPAIQRLAVDLGGALHSGRAVGSVEFTRVPPTVRQIGGARSAVRPRALAGACADLAGRFRLGENFRRRMLVIAAVGFRIAAQGKCCVTRRVVCLLCPKTSRRLCRIA